MLYHQAARLLLLCLSSAPGSITQCFRGKQACIVWLLCHQQRCLVLRLPADCSFIPW